jgi:hypothetical protein
MSDAARIPEDRMAPWPWDWYALLDGEEGVNGDESYRLSTVECGELNVQSGKLLACDPFAAMRGGGRDPWVNVPPGEYPITLTLADVDGDGSDMREAYVSLLLGGDEVERRQLCQGTEKGTPKELVPGEFWGFGVDSGTVCLVDKVAIDRDMPAPNTWEKSVFESKRNRGRKPSPGWFFKMDAPKHIRAGVANITLPKGDGSTNIFLAHSGWGDGFYPLIGGFDAEGVLVAVHIDLLVVGGPPDEEELAEAAAAEAAAKQAEEREERHEARLEEYRGALRGAKVKQLGIILAAIAIGAGIAFVLAGPQMAGGFAFVLAAVLFRSAFNAVEELFASGRSTLELPPEWEED